MTSDQSSPMGFLHLGHCMKPRPSPPRGSSATLKGRTLLQREHTEKPAAGPMLLHTRQCALFPNGSSITRILPAKTCSRIETYELSFLQ
jgi:hypothetical protein